MKPGFFANLTDEQKRRVLEQRTDIPHVFPLPADTFERFVRALEEPPEPKPALVKAIRAARKKYRVA